MLRMFRNLYLFLVFLSKVKLTSLGDCVLIFLPNSLVIYLFGDGLIKIVYPDTIKLITERINIEAKFIGFNSEEQLQNHIEEECQREPNYQLY